MNATRWVTLTGFVSHLGQAGIVRVEDTEKGLFITWIDNSPKALAKAVRTLSLTPRSRLIPLVGCKLEEGTLEQIGRTERARNDSGADRTRRGPTGGSARR
jgi:hypothetical protein